MATKKTDFFKLYVAEHATEEQIREAAAVLAERTGTHPDVLNMLTQRLPTSTPGLTA